MKYAALFILFLSLSACGGLGKPRPEAASYDFGLTLLPAATAWPAQLPVADVEAPSGLDSKTIRYRLAYREPARVYAYTLSQWTATPAELLTRRLRQSAGGQQSLGAGCSLQVTLEAFDHVFETEHASLGSVRLHAIITDHKRRSVITQNTFAQSQPAPTQDAQGGVAALSLAADAALRDIVAWVATASSEGKLRACTD